MRHSDNLNEHQRMNITCYIHLPEINISDTSLKVGPGEIIRLPVEKWILMDRYYERFQTQIKRNGEPIFYCCSPSTYIDSEKAIEFLTTISKRVHLCLIIYTGEVTALPELSVKYILFEKNKGKSEVGDLLQKSIGDAGREYIVNDYTKIILDKGEENAINSIYNFLFLKQSNIDSFIINYFISTLVSMGLLGLSLELKITHLVSSIENLLLSDITKNIRQNFTNQIQQIIGQINIRTNNLETLIQTSYDIRSAVVHGKDAYPVFRKTGVDSKSLFEFILQVYLIILLKILDNLPENATQTQIKGCLTDLINKNVSFPNVNPRWLKT